MAREIKSTGPEQCSLMCVAERPGIVESRVGKVLVGPSGQEFDRFLLNESGIPRDRIHCRNLVTDYRDGENPEEWEVSRDWHLTVAVIQQIRPKYVMAMGLWSARAFLGHDVEMEWASGLHFPVKWNCGSFTVMPVTHTAATLHQPKYAARCAEDFRAFGRMIRGEPLPTGHLESQVGGQYHVYSISQERDTGLRRKSTGTGTEERKWLLDMDTRLCGEAPKPSTCDVCNEEKQRKRPQVPVRAISGTDTKEQTVASYVRKSFVCESSSSGAADNDSTPTTASEADLHNGSSTVSLVEVHREKELLGVSGMSKDTFISIDTEGTVTNPWGLQYSIQEREATVVLAKHAGKQDIKVRVVGHNLLHDLSVLRSMGVTLCRFEDTMLMAALLGTEPLGLKPLARRHCGMVMSEYAEIVADARREKALDYLGRVLDWCNEHETVEV